MVSRAASSPPPVLAFDPGWRRVWPAPLRPEAIHLWAVQLESDSDSEGGDCADFNDLGESERARAGRIVQPARRALYLGGRAGLRRLLCAYSGLGNRALRFGAGPRGKPKLLNALPGGELCFNYSLSGRRALYAIAWNRALGVDLETLPRASNTAGLARRMLSAAELQAWRALPVGAQDAAMLAIWTRKEAYGKALGVGIRYALKRAEVFADTGPRWRCRVAGLFPGTVAETPARELHGVQLATPFAAVAALVYDGEPVADDALSGGQISLAALATVGAGVQPNSNVVMP